MRANRTPGMSLMEVGEIAATRSRAAYTRDFIRISWFSAADPGYQQLSSLKVLPEYADFMQNSPSLGSLSTASAMCEKRVSSTTQMEEKRRPSNRRVRGLHLTVGRFRIFVPCPAYSQKNTVQRTRHSLRRRPM